VHYIHNFSGCFGTADGIVYTTRTTLNAYKEWAGLSFNMKTFSGWANGIININHIDSKAGVPLGAGDPETASPIVNAGPDQTILISELYSLDATIEDYDSDTLTITIDWDDLSSPTVIPIVFTGDPEPVVDLADHKYALPGIYTVTVTADTERDGYLYDEETGDLTPETFEYTSFGTTLVTVLAPDPLVEISSPNPTGYNIKRTLPVNVIVLDQNTNTTILGATVEVFMSEFPNTNVPVTCKGTTSNIAVYTSSIDQYQCHVELKNYDKGLSYDVIAKVGDTTSPPVTITVE
jgi:hypothetical protein